MLFWASCLPTFCQCLSLSSKFAEPLSLTENLSSFCYVANGVLVGIPKEPKYGWIVLVAQIVFFFSFQSVVTWPCESLAGNGIFGDLHLEHGRTSLWKVDTGRHKKSIKITVLGFLGNCLRRESPTKFFPCYFHVHENVRRTENMCYKKQILRQIFSLLATLLQNDWWCQKALIWICRTQKELKIFLDLKSWRG